MRLPINEIYVVLKCANEMGVSMKNAMALETLIKTI